MFDLDNWQEIFHTLLKNKLRTFLTALGVFWGIFMLVFMMGAGSGMKNGVTQDFGSFATNSFYIWTQQTSVEYAGLPAGRRFYIQNDDIPAVRAAIPELDILSPRNQLRGYGGGNNVSRGTKSGAFSVMGDYPQMMKINPLMIHKGRFINEFDIEHKRKVCVIGDRVAEVLFEVGDDPIDQNIMINGVYFKIVGVFGTKRSNDRADRDLETVHIPFSTFQKAFNYGNVVGWFACTAKNKIPASKVESKVIALLKQRHKVSPADERAFGSYNVEKDFKKMSNVFSGINILIWVVGLGTLLAGVIGVSNIMLIVVKERTSEIGIRRAIGASPANITRQIIMESIILTAIAGYFGLLFGVIIIEGASMLLENAPDVQFIKNPTVDFAVAVKALIVLVVCGALAGFIPARRAISISTVDAIRSEQ